MRILITNDDGIHAAGPRRARTDRRGLSDDVIVVAPEYDQSGVAHSLSLNDPLRLRKISRAPFRGQGHADRLRHHGRALDHEGQKPDLVLSGVNRGQNVAEDVTYSGTIAGAMEGTMLGIPSIALSQGYGPTASGRCLGLAPKRMRRGSSSACSPRASTAIC